MSLLTHYHGTLLLFQGGQWLRLIDSKQSGAVHLPPGPRILSSNSVQHPSPAGALRSVQHASPASTLRPAQNQARQTQNPSQSASPGAVAQRIVPKGRGQVNQPQQRYRHEFSMSSNCKFR